MTDAGTELLSSTGREDAFLRRLASGDDVSSEVVALVVAHPDDEVLGLGAQLSRLKGLTIVHVTDGAPHNGGHGFGTREAYAAARGAELAAALAPAGIGADARVGFDVPDQEAALDLTAIVRRLTGLFRERGVKVVLTHAYEGGHPDHDAVAFAVHAARRLLAPESEAPGVIEMPFYHVDDAGWVRQRFVAGSGPPELALRLSDESRALKQRMFDAHATQRETLLHFPPEWERFRAAPAYDFTALPNRGNLLYERYPWGMTGAKWLELSGRALTELGLATPCA